MNNTLKVALSGFFTMMIFTACHDNNPKVLDVNLKETEKGYSITYRPEMNFRQVPNDSVHIYLTQQDMIKVMSSEIKIGDRLLKTEEFSLYTLLVENYTKNVKRYQIVLRTYDNKMKHINDLILASTTESPEFGGYVTPEATITRNSVNGKYDKYALATNGTFQFIEKSTDE